MKNILEPKVIYKNYFKSFNLIAFLQNKLARQTSILFSSEVILLVIVVLAGIFNTRYLGPDGYGTYCFILALISFQSIFFGFGFIAAGTRLIALASNKESEREIVGSVIIIGIGIALIFSITVFISSLFIDKIFQTNIKSLVMLISILSGVLPFQLMIKQMLRGANRISEMAFFNVFPKLWYLALILIVITISDLNAYNALFLNLGGILIACLIAVRQLQPILKVKEHFQLIRKEVREYGFHVYLARIVSTSTYKLDNLFIASFLNTTSVGFYTLSTTLVSPMSILSGSMSISLFKGFTRAKRIDNKVILFNLVWLLSCIGCLTIMGKFIVLTLFTERFLPVVPLILPLAIAGFFQGMYTPFNMFLAAHRKGKELRFISFVEAVFNVIGNLILIYYYGAMGAAIASAIVKGIDLALHLYFYKKTVEKTAIP